jgi:hypothetical protein
MRRRERCRAPRTQKPDDQGSSRTLPCSDLAHEQTATCCAASRTAPKEALASAPSALPFSVIKRQLVVKRPVDRLDGNGKFLHANRRFQPARSWWLLPNPERFPFPPLSRISPTGSSPVHVLARAAPYSFRIAASHVPYVTDVSQFEAPRAR